jgi:hypothetical protein
LVEGFLAWDEKDDRIVSERLLQIMSSDAATSEQYRDTFRRSELLEPEKALLIALLDDAIHDYRKYSRANDHAGQGRFRRAFEWIMADDDEWIFSFVNVCELLNLDPEYVRRGLREAKDSLAQQRRQRLEGARGRTAQTSQRAPKLIRRSVNAFTTSSRPSERLQKSETAPPIYWERGSARGE